MPEADERVNAYAERKQTMVIELIEAGEFTAYPDALRFIIAVKDAGIRVAAASSSKNAGLFLRQIRLDTFAQENSITSQFVTPGLSLLDFFDADVSGRDFAHGKPDPEMFLTAAHELGTAPAASFVIEDAAAGVQAAKAGNMSALGLARADDAELLAKANADLVVTTLDDVDTPADARLVSRKQNSPPSVRAGWARRSSMSLSASAPRSRHSTECRSHPWPLRASVDGSRFSRDLSPGLKDLDGFSHLSHPDPPSRRCARRTSSSSRSSTTLLRGVFATRSPRHPNPIGLSVVRLMAVYYNTGLEIEGRRPPRRHSQFSTSSPTCPSSTRSPPSAPAGWQARRPTCTTSGPIDASKTDAALQLELG